MQHYRAQIPLYHAGARFVSHPVTSVYWTCEYCLPFNNNVCKLFAETMSFAGLAPEIINGRAAMVGMLAAFGAELRTHEPVIEQVSASYQRRLTSIA